MKTKPENQLTGAVIGAAIAVHRELGPGHDETNHEHALSRALHARGIQHSCQVPLPIDYGGTILDCGYRIDVEVDSSLILELKAIEQSLPVHQAQVLTYMRLRKRRLGLLINFRVPVLKEGITRMVLDVHPLEMQESLIEEMHRFESHSREIIAAALTVHGQLGPGLLKSTYEECLCYELAKRELAFERRKQIPTTFGGEPLPHPMEIGLLVTGDFPVMLLSVMAINPVHKATLLAELRQGGWRAGLILNFNVKKLAQGIRRIVNPALRGANEKVQPVDL